MRPRFLLIVASVITLASMCPASLFASDPAPLTLQVMSFNLRFASPQPPNAWPDRRPVVQRLIAREKPDLIGTQEGLYHQLRDIALDSSDYDWIGLGRDGGSRGEFMAVFYRRDRFEPVAFDHFWLSDTPEVIGSKTWGNRYARMVTWVRFRERPTGREFYFWNTHFDHEVELARQKSAELVRARLTAIDATIPLLLVGDFNCPAGNSVAYDVLTRDAGLFDTWSAADARENENLNTFHGYTTPLSERVRIDWILARRAAGVQRAAILDYHEETQYPSDHFPVVATVHF